MDIILNPTVQSVEVNTPTPISTVVVREDDTSLEIIGQGTTSVVAETQPEATVIIVTEEVGSVNVKTVEDHAHPISEITALQAALDSKANTSHSHDASQIVSGTLANARVSQGSVTQHQAALSVTKSQVSDFAHTHTEAEIVDLGNYSQVGHTHLTGDVVDWPAEFPPSAHTHDTTEISDWPLTFPPDSHTHDTTEITDWPTEFPPEAHTHTIADITDVGDLPSGVTWGNTSLTTITAEVNKGYALFGASIATITLPSVAAVSDVIRIADYSGLGFRIAQNSGQVIKFGHLNTTSGVSGYIDSTWIGDSIELVCVTANTTFVVASSVGTFEVV